jgi:hypothetical protein
MAYAYLLRDGTGEARIASRLMVHASTFRGRRLSRGYAALPVYSLGGTVGAANPVANASRVALRIDDSDEAKHVGAKPGAYHIVLDFSPSDLHRTLASGL